MTKHCPGGPGLDLPGGQGGGPVDAGWGLPTAGLTHLREDGAVHMVDVGEKDTTRREAVASAEVHMQPATLERIQANSVAKGNVLATARIAGIQAAKNTSSLIPLCHPLALSHVGIDLEPLAAGVLEIRCTARVVGRTGVEMEAMCGVSVAALTIYDMVKSVDRGVVIRAIKLVEKRGGRSGHWQRPGEDGPF